MIGVLIVGGGLGWLVHRAHVQRDAVAAVRKAGGSVRYDWQTRKVLGSPAGRPWYPSWLARVVGDDYFQTAIWVDLLRGVDRDLEFVARLDRIEHLNLSEASVTDNGVARLRPLTRLSWLSLSRCPVTDAAVIHLERFPGLYGLDLNGTKVSDAGLESLGRLNHLESLYLAVTNVTDAGLVHLERLPNLRTLNLQGTGVTDAGVSRLKRVLPKLEVIR